MAQAFALAQQAAKEGEVPVGAVIVRAGECLGKGYNQVRQLSDASAHAEMLAMRQAMQHLGYERLEGSTLYVTLEPCMMCMGALLHARVSRLVFGARDYRAGAAGSMINLARGFKVYPAIQVDEGVMHGDCEALLKQFFQATVRDT